MILEHGPQEIDVFLDDLGPEYRPAPEGWVRCQTVEQVKELLLTGLVRHLSLDHDLGACDSCMGGLTTEEWMARAMYSSMPNCSHVGTGYDLCLWMAERDLWPRIKPTVHSMNSVGRERMQGVIDRYFPTGERP